MAVMEALLFDLNGIVDVVVVVVLVSFVFSGYISYIWNGIVNWIRAQMIIICMAAFKLFALVVELQSEIKYILCKRYGCEQLRRKSEVKNRNEWGCNAYNIVVILNIIKNERYRALSPSVQHTSHLCIDRNGLWKRFFLLWWWEARVNGCTLTPLNILSYAFRNFAHSFCLFHIDGRRAFTPFCF